MKGSSTEYRNSISVQPAIARDDRVLSSSARATSRRSNGSRLAKAACERAARRQRHWFWSKLLSVAQLSKLAVELARVCGSLALAAAATGCGCVTMDAARAMDRQLVLRNRAQAEPAMKAAARFFGAVLQPAEAQTFEIAPLCEGYVQCLDVIESTGVFSRVRDSQGRPRLAIWVPAKLRRYVRLAQGSDRLLLLTPKVSHRVIAEKTCCECDGMPRSVVRSQAAFLVDEIPGVKIVTVNVPMIADENKWKCKVVLR